MKRHTTNKSFRFFIATTVIAIHLYSCDSQEYITLSSGTLFSSLSEKITPTDMKRDQSGRLWITTANDGVYLYDGMQGIHFLPTGEAGSLPSFRVNCVLADSHGTTWFATGKGICKFNPEALSFDDVMFPEPWSDILQLLEDRNGRILAVTAQGIYVYDSQIAGFRKLISQRSHDIRKVTIDGQRDKIIIIRSQELEIYDGEGNSAGIYPINTDIVNSCKISNDRLFLNAFQRRLIFNLENLEFEELPSSWQFIKDPDSFALISSIGTDDVIFAYKNKLYKYDFASHIMLGEDEPMFPFVSDVPGDDIMDIFHTEEQEIWISSYSRGLVRAKVCPEGTYQPLDIFISGHDVKDLCSDNKFIWMIADGINLVSYEIGTGKISVKDIGQIVNRHLKTNKSCSLVYDDSAKRLLLSFDNNILETSAGAADGVKLRHHYVGSFISHHLTMHIDKRGRIWSGGDNGGLQVSPENPSAEVFQRQQAVNTDKLLSSSSCMALANMRDGRIAAAFDHTGILIINPDNGQTQFYDAQKELGSLNIQSLCQGPEGYLWIGTRNGNYYIDLQTDKLIKSAFFQDNSVSGIIRDANDNMYVFADGNLFVTSPGDHAYRLLKRDGDVSSNSLCVMENGDVLAVMGNHFYDVHPGSKLSASSHQDNAVLLLADENDRILASKPLSLSAEGKRKITIPSSYRSFSVAILNFGEKNTDFAYKTESRKSDWERMQNLMRFSLSRLNNGSHKIWINSFEIPDLANGNVYKFNLYIRHPWYTSGIAKGLYLSLFCMVLWIILHLVRVNQRARIDKAMAIREKEMQEKLNQKNIDMFADFSHEFRSPLTIISGAANTLLGQYGADSQQFRLIHSVQRNADRMMKLVNQFMDFNKISHNQLKLQVQSLDIVRLIRSVASDFESAAEIKDITLTVIVPDNLIGYIDQDKVEIITYNILSNAIKYTPAGGSVEILMKSIDDNGKSSLSLQVTDSGIGIPEDKLEEIFERFARVGAGKDAGGFGIGLYFARKLAEFHHGSITAANRSDNKSGSIFTLTLPIDFSSYAPAEIRAETEDTRKAIDIHKYMSEYTSRPLRNLNQEAPAAKKILVIDDDSEILYYVKLLLSAHYDVIVSSDASSGYRKIEAEHPDMVISDVMMMEMDGIELCRMVKGNQDTCHIPFILLTAKSTVQDQITGLNAGADAYIAKPFEPDYLESVINSLFRSQENFRQTLGKQTSIENVDTSSLSETDRILLDKMYKIMNDDLMDTELNISKICQIIGVSRTKFYYKIKDLTGQTPNDFFKTYKLNRAAEMLKEGKLKISAISDLVGFSSASHFAVAFKKQFGVLPSKY